MEAGLRVRTGQLGPLVPRLALLVEGLDHGRPALQRAMQTTGAQRIITARQLVSARVGRRVAGERGCGGCGGWGTTHFVKQELRITEVSIITHFVKQELRITEVSIEPTQGG